MATRENKIVTLPAHIRVRRDTLANWTSINPVLDDGELAIVRMPDGSITMRVGTGTDSFKNLPDISNSSADEIHVLDGVNPTEQPTGTLSTSDYELCANNNVIGIQLTNGQVGLLYKSGEYNGSYAFFSVIEDGVFAFMVASSKEYRCTIQKIPSSLEVYENIVKMDNDQPTGVAFDLAKDGSGKVQISLNGTAVGTGITLPGHAVADIEGLQTALDGKANSIHTHVHTDVTDFDASVDSRIDAKLDGLPEVTIPEYTLQSGSAEGTVALYKDGTGSDVKVNGYDNLKAQAELIPSKQNKTDNSLNTTAKTVVGSINELKSALDELKPADQGGSGSTTGTAPTVPAVAAAVSDGAGRNIQDTYIEEVQTASAEDVSGVLNAVFGS